MEYESLIKEVVGCVGSGFVSLLLKNVLVMFTISRNWEGQSWIIKNPEIKASEYRKKRDVVNTMEHLIYARLYVT